MRARIHDDIELRLTLTQTDDRVVHTEDVTANVAELVEELHTSSVLSGRISDRARVVSADVSINWSRQPSIRSLGVQLTVDQEGATIVCRKTFVTGRWKRRAMAVAEHLIADGVLRKDDVVYVGLIGERRSSPVEVPLPPLEPPLIERRTLESLGVRRIQEAGELAPERPVLINARMLADILRQTERSGPSETGGAVLGKIVQLDQRLPGTETSIVTVLSVGLPDSRHEGSIGRFKFSPEAMIEAARISRLRGKGETVQTAWHSHGWGSECGNCNEKRGCALPECTLVSSDDYQVLSSLFPSKSTLFPIAGRKLGAGVRHPVMVLHAWRGGEMGILPYKEYED
jgi:Prokaryotic homologs of the JAB domain